MSKLIFHSRAKAEKDWECQRKRYYSYDYFDGIVKDNLTLDLFIGTVLHDGLAAIVTAHLDSGKVDIDLISTVSRSLVKDTLVEYHAQAFIDGVLPEASTEHLHALEQSTLVEALLRGFYKHQWPAIIANYNIIVASEKETIYPHDISGKLNLKGPFVYCAKPDLLLEGPDGSIYFELKSTGNKKVEWMNSWNNAPQVHGTAKAIEFTFKEAPLGTIVQGMYKGSTMYGKFSSPLVYAYATKGNPPFTKGSVSTEFKYGHKRTPVWELDGDVKSYIELFTPEQLSEQFPQTPLIFTKEDMATDFFRQRAIRERDVMLAKAELDFSDITPEEKLGIMDKIFPQSFSKCTPSFGFSCEYERICHGPAKDDPLSFGFIQKQHGHEQPYLDLAKERLG